VSGDLSKSVRMGRAGFFGAMASFLPGEVAMEMMSAGVEPSVLAVTMAWTAVLAMGCTAALVIAQNIYLHRPWLDSRTGLLAFGGGFIFGAVSGCLAQVFFSLAVAAGQGSPLFVEMSRVVAWAIFGGLVGLGMSFVIPNLGKDRGAVAGAVGGGVGAIGFIFGGAIAGDVAGRAIGLSIIGFTLGYAIGLVEEATRTAWLQVSYGQSRESVKVSLGPEPVCVGSNSQQCAIWAQGVRPIALRFRYVNGQILCDDMATEQTVVAAPGFETHLGNVRLLVCAGATAGRGGSAAPHSGVVPPPPPAPAPRPPAVSPVSAVGPGAPRRVGSPPLPPPPPPPPPR
jgi:hypothetical protein